MEDLVPMLVILPIAGLVITIVIVSAIKKLRERDHRHNERMRALELGVELPPEIDGRPGHRNRPRDESIGLQGIIWTGVGAGLLAARFLLADVISQDPDTAETLGFLSLWAFPALFVGVGLLIYARTLRKRSDG